MTLKLKIVTQHKYKTTVLFYNTKESLRISYCRPPDTEILTDRYALVLSTLTSDLGALHLLLAPRPTTWKKVCESPTVDPQTPRFWLTNVPWSFPPLLLISEPFIYFWRQDLPRERKSLNLLLLTLQLRVFNWPTYFGPFPPLLPISELFVYFWRQDPPRERKSPESPTVDPQTPRFWLTNVLWSFPPLLPILELFVYFWRQDLPRVTHRRGFLRQFDAVQRCRR